jgi:outer membrane protein insertion porin family
MQVSIPQPYRQSIRGDVQSRLPVRGSMLVLICLGLLLIAGNTVFAQTPGSGTPAQPASTSEAEQILSSYEGQNVSSIEIAGQPNYTKSQYEHLLVQQIGQPFSREQVGKTADALKSAGNFEHVDTRVEPESDGVRIVFVLQPAVYFGVFQFPGAERFPYSQLIQTADYPVQKAFNPSEVETDGQSLVTFFRQEGYFNATVAPQIAVDSAHAIANINFDSSLGARAGFGSISIEGAPNGEEAALQRKLTTFTARLRGTAIQPRKQYRSSTLTKANQYLQSTLEKKGYLSAQVKLAGAEYHAASNQADIHFDVNAGAMTHVQIDGAHIWSWARKSLLPEYQGIGVDDETVLEGQDALTSYFQAKGFFDVRVESQFRKEDGNTVVSYHITKDKKHKVTAVNLSGNVTLPSAKLTPQIAVDKKRFFYSGKFSEQLVQTSVKNLKAVYQSEGFSAVQVTSSVTRKAGNVQVSFHVVEGPRDVVSSIAIEGADTFPESEFAPNGLNIAPGKPYSQALVQADRASILANYIRAGYLISNFRETASEVSKSEPHRINVVYRIDEGPRVMTGDVVTLGRNHTQQRLIDRDVAEIKERQPLTETALLTAGSQLYDHAGVFDWAEVDLKEPITAQNRDDVLVKVHEAKRNDFTYGFGFEVIERGGSIPSGTVALPNLPPIGLPTNFTTSEATFYGPRGTAQYTRNNLFGKGESISFTGFAGRLDQRGAVYYIDPNFRWSSWKATTSFSAERDEENPVFSSQQELGTLQMQRALDKEKKNIFFVQYGFSQVDLTRLLIPSLVPTQDQHVRLSTLSANITRDTRDNALDEHKGVLESLEMDFNSSKLGSSADFAKLTGQAAYYKEKIHHIVWANSIRVGLAEPFNKSFVPLSQAFFSGGGSSLRGFPLDGAGPQRSVDVCSSGSSTNCTLIRVPNGGNELLILNSEARIPLPIKKGLSIVVFYDGGNVFPYVGFHDFASLYANNVGLGLRYETPIGPIRVDIGRNLNPVQGINATNYFVGIGQAF